MEVAPCDDLSEVEEPPRAVKLRLKGVGATAVSAVPDVKLEAAVVVVTAVQQTDRVKELSSKLWHANREKGKLVRECASRVRELQGATKIRSRAAIQAIVRVSEELDQAGHQVKRLRNDNNYLAKLRYRYEGGAHHGFGAAAGGRRAGGEQF